MYGAIIIQTYVIFEASADHYGRISRQKPELFLAINLQNYIALVGRVIFLLIELK